MQTYWCKVQCGSDFAGSPWHTGCRWRLLHHPCMDTAPLFGCKFSPMRRLGGSHTLENKHNFRYCLDENIIILQTASIFQRKCFMLLGRQTKCLRLLKVRIFLEWRSRDSAVVIATGYGLDNREVGVTVPTGSRILTSPCHPDRVWGPQNILYNGYWWLFRGGKAAGEWN
jgi:hypothetical protein